MAQKRNIEQLHAIQQTCLSYLSRFDSAQKGTSQFAVTNQDRKASAEFRFLLIVKRRLNQSRLSRALAKLQLWLRNGLRVEGTKESHNSNGIKRMK